MDPNGIHNHNGGSEQEVMLVREDEQVALTAEQEEEMKLRAKYPNPQKSGGSTFVQRMLQKGVWMHSNAFSWL